MKDYVLELTSKQTGYNAKLNIMREYLQAYILRLMHEEGVFRSTVFLGGTALRFLYDLPRFSEDLDFSLVEGKGIDFSGLIKKIKDELILAGYEISLTYNVSKTVNNAFIKFQKLMYETGISPLKTQNFPIKIEIDINPPEGAVLRTEIVNKYFPVSFLTYNLSSLFAGKLNAILSRKYTKGRDLFDLMWYLSKWKDLNPNLVLLNSGLKQMAWKGEELSESNWAELIYRVILDVDWEKVKHDVQNFLERPEDVNIFTKKNVLSLLKHRK